MALSLRPEGMGWSREASSLYFLVPQQTGVPSGFTAQLLNVATARSLTGPRSAGTSVLPPTLSPQQDTVSSSLMAQAWRVSIGLAAISSRSTPWKVAATSLALSPGGGAGGLTPQQTTPSSMVTAQLKKAATASDLALRPSGGVNFAAACPQQRTLWSVLRTQSWL